MTLNVATLKAPAPPVMVGVRSMSVLIEPVIAPELEPEPSGPASIPRVKVLPPTV